MKFDYCEIENGADETLDIFIGCRFDDEPEELYVIQLYMQRDGNVLDWKLLFNGLDCKYAFKDEEKASIRTYYDEVMQTNDDKR